MFKGDIKDASDATGKYLSAMRRAVHKKWEKRLAWRFDINALKIIINLIWSYFYESYVIKSL